VDTTGPLDISRLHGVNDYFVSCEKTVPPKKKVK
jgi:hypothetical protein